MASETIRLAILRSLLDGRSYGLEIIGRVEKLTNGKIRLHQASIYQILRDIEDDGLALSYYGDPVPERGWRPRRYYELTAKGRTVAEAFRA